MIRYNGNQKFLVYFTIIIAFQISFLPPAFSQNPGVVIDQTGDFRFREGIRPFVSIKGDLFLDPARGEIILLFPKQQVPKIVQPVESEVETEKIAIRKTNINTEIGTQRGTTTNKKK
jgi:hypothetical protein